MIRYRSRYIEAVLEKTLNEKMVFLGGPRQVGKTRLVKELANRCFKSHFTYLNWDVPRERKIILDQAFKADDKLLIFDEIHKLRQWKLYLKGIFDGKGEDLRILATGSARLSVYKKGGDSLLGRYRHYRLHPLSLAEVSGSLLSQTPFKALKFHEASIKSKKLLTDLDHFGGFPEVFFAKDEVKLRQWQNERLDSLVREDVRDLERVSDLSAIFILAHALPSKVGSLFSLNSLREDLGVAHKTITHWVQILEELYYHFRITPYGARHSNFLKKEPKLYLWDWSEVEQPSARFENLMASHLLKFVHYLYDCLGYRADLQFIRNKRGEEVDFIVTIDHKPWFAVELKESDENPARPLLEFGAQLKIPYLYQVVRNTRKDVMSHGVRILSAEKFLSGLV